MYKRVISECKPEDGSSAALYRVYGEAIIHDVIPPAQRIYARIGGHDSLIQYHQLRLAEGLSYLEHAANAGDADAQYGMYHLGALQDRSINDDSAEAIEEKALRSVWLKKAADSGSAVAAYWWSWKFMVLNHDPVKLGFPECVHFEDDVAKSYMQQAASAGHRQATEFLEAYKRHNAAIATLITKENHTAVEHLYLGFHIALGKRKTDDHQFLPENLDKARMHLERALELGQFEAVKYLTLLHENQGSASLKSFLTQMTELAHEPSIILLGDIRVCEGDRAAAIRQYTKGKLLSNYEAELALAEVESATDITALCRMDFGQ